MFLCDILELEKDKFEAQFNPSSPMCSILSDGEFQCENGYSLTSNDCNYLQCSNKQKRIDAVFRWLFVRTGYPPELYCFQKMFSSMQFFKFENPCCNKVNFKVFYRLILVLINSLNFN